MYYRLNYLLIPNNSSFHQKRLLTFGGNDGTTPKNYPLDVNKGRFADITGQLCPFSWRLG
jgi:hypothetical protein